MNDTTAELKDALDRTKRVGDMIHEAHTELADGPIVGDLCPTMIPCLMELTENVLASCVLAMCGHGRPEEGRKLVEAHARAVEILPFRIGRMMQENGIDNPWEQESHNETVAREIMDEIKAAENGEGNEPEIEDAGRRQQES